MADEHGERAQAGEGEDTARPWGRRYLLVLALLALATRLVWVLFVHPPDDYVFSDMRMYVRRAMDLAEHGLHPKRSLAWQAYGTHFLLAIPFKLFGFAKPALAAFRAAAVLYGLYSAGAVLLCYFVARRLFHGRERMARLCGIAALCWYPNMSTSGHFLSEPPFLFFNLLATLQLVRLLQEGRGALWAGLFSAVAFAVRPQSAIFLALALLVWLVNARRLPVRARHILAVGAPLAAILAFSLWRFHMHTGRWGGIAENAHMNLTAGRCHNVITQAFRTHGAKYRSERRNNTRDGRRVSLPGFRILRQHLPDDHVLGLRPAVGVTIRFVGYIGEPELHRELRAECYRRTGFWGQVQYSLVNLGLQWFVAKQWPTNERGSRVFLPITEFFRHLFQILLLIPSLVGMGAALRSIRRDPARALVAAQLLSIIIVAATFFGDPRLRTPYDPYAILLAAPVYDRLWRWWRARRAARAGAPTSDG